MRGPGPVVAVRTAPREGTPGWWPRGVPRRRERARGPVHGRDRRAGGSAWRWVVVNGYAGRLTGGTDGPVAARCASSSTTARRTTHVGRPRRHPCVQGPATRCRCPREFPLRLRRWGLLDPVPGCRRHVSRTSIELSVCGRGGELRDFIRMHCVSSPLPRPPVVRVLGCEPRRLGRGFT